MGVHPFGDPSIVDDFERVTLPIEPRVPRLRGGVDAGAASASTWTSELVQEVAQSPAYPMQLMLSVYEFADGSGAGVSGRELSEGVPRGLGPRLARR